MNPERIALITDSTCDLPLSLLAEKEITMVPLSVSWEDAEFLDNVELSTDQFYARLAAAEDLPTTSAPPVGLFLEAFEKLRSQGFTHVLGLFLTRKFSGTVQSAQTAAKMISGLTLEMLDSRSASWGQGLLVLHAHQLIQSGLPFDEITAQVQVRCRASLVAFSLGKLDALQRGGRIGKASAFLGNAFGIRPILALPGDTGEIEVAGKVRSSQATIQALLLQAQKHVGLQGLVQGVTVLHGARPDMAATLLAAFQNSGDNWKNLSIGRIGAVIGTHVGPDVWGIALC
ncbi:MAG: DegV family protein [Candidatus Firestonebacteria bacterium]|nr:DegV family protein [Candidatus Firestonebacteria bacterium]